MSRFILGDCVRVMATIPDNAIDFILTDPPYLVGFRDRSGRTIAGDVNDDWLQPASNEMYRVLKKDAVDSICQCNTPFNYLFRCFELQCLSRSVV